MINKQSYLIKERLIELTTNDELPMDLTQLDPSIFDPYTTHRMYVVDSDSNSVRGAFGIDNERNEILCKHLSNCFCDAYLPSSKPTITRAELMANVSSICESSQELGYIMFKFGAEEQSFVNKVNHFMEDLSKK